MLTLITNMRPYLEAVYFIASILLLCGILLTFLQVRLIKRDTRDRNRRAAAEKAIEACDRYFCGYIPLSSKNFLEISEKKIGSYDGEIGDFTNSSISEKSRPRSYKRFSANSWLPAMNQLEAISAVFISGVADESVGFNIIGRSYCSTVEYNYDVISMSRREKANPYWSNVVELYKLWSPRLSKAAIDLELQEMQRRSEAIKPVKLAPLGGC